MPEKVPQSLKGEHESLRATLKRAMREAQKTGEVARKLAALADAHFLLEEKLVLPLLGMLPALAHGESGAAVAQAATLVQGLRQQLPRLLAEHREIAAGLRELASAAEAEGKPEYVDFAEQMVVHAHMEEEMLYPAALVAGDYVRKLRGE